MSASRTGLLSLLLFLLICFFYLRRKLFAYKHILIVLSSLIIIICSFKFQPFLIYKLKELINEIAVYQWNSMNIDTSVGMRISFLRMGFYYFTTKPFTGWGDLGWMILADNPDLTYYATEFTRYFPKAGFHNQFMTYSVRSGIWGLFSILYYFIIPVVISFYYIIKFKSNNYLRFICFICLIYIGHFIICSLTTDTLDLIFMSSLSGLLYAVILGVINRESLNSNNNNYI
jgi:O-antigen ligase